jgi:predicted acylesterase/phospholipase RssA
VTYTNFTTGELVHVSPADPGIKRGDFIDALIASASIPVAMEPVQIDGETCYDGGVRDVLPLGHAIRLGAERILPLTLYPQDLPRAEQGLGRIDRVGVRALDIVSHETVRNDEGLAELINIAVRVRLDLEAAFSNDPQARQKVEDVLGGPEYTPLFDPDHRLVEIITGLQPDEQLTDDSLEFDPEQMRRWIEMGAEKAREVITDNPFARRGT